MDFEDTLDRFHKILQVNSLVYHSRYVLYVPLYDELICLLILL